MPASASARSGSAPALVLRPGAPMLSASATPSRPRLRGAALRAASHFSQQVSPRALVPDISSTGQAVAVRRCEICDPVSDPYVSSYVVAVVFIFCERCE